MKKLIVLAILMAVMVLVAALTHAHSPANDLKPTFISPTPGLYVNGWPPFTVSYPKEWVEMPNYMGDVFVAGMARPDIATGVYVPLIRIDVNSTPLPLEDWTKMYMPVFLQFATDIKVLYDKPSQLKDGTPAREAEVEFLYKLDPTFGSLKDTPKYNNFVLMTKRDLAFVGIWMIDDQGTIGEDLKKYAYSFTFLQGREEPVQVPPDVRAFLDMYCADTVSHDVKTIMAHYSDRFHHSGGSKVAYEQWFRKGPGSPIQMGVISQEATVTVFEPHGDKAYIDGFWLRKTKGNATALKASMSYRQIINEHGEWKWFGNQK